MGMSHSDWVCHNSFDKIIDEVGDGEGGFNQKDFDRLQHEIICKEVDDLYEKNTILTETLEQIYSFRKSCGARDGHDFIMSVVTATFEKVKYL